MIVVDDPQAARPLQLAASISPDPRSQFAAEVVPQSQLAGVDWDQVSLLLWQAAVPETDTAKQIRVFIDRGGSAIFFPPRTPGGGEFFGVRWTAWADQKDGIPVVSWRGDEDLLAHTASGAPLPVGELADSASTAASPATSRPWPRCKAGRRCWRGPRRATARVYFCATTPAPAIRHWRRAALCSMCSCSERSPTGAAVPGQHAAAQAGDAPATPQTAGSGCRELRKRSRPTTRFTAAFIRPGTGCWR